MNRNIFSEKVLGCWLLAAMIVLAAQLVSLAQQLPCQEPNDNTVLCKQGLPNGVTSCTGLTKASCGTAHIYNIIPFPDGTQPSATGVTKQIQADCYQDTPCQWSTTENKCIPGDTLPGPNNTDYYQAPKTVPDDSKKCPKGG